MFPSTIEELHELTAFQEVLVQHTLLVDALVPLTQEEHALPHHLPPHNHWLPLPELCVCTSSESERRFGI